MKGKKHTPEQIIRKLREADAMFASGKTIGQVCQALEVSEQTFHRKEEMETVPVTLPQPVLA
jgi:putative transposase